MSPRMRTALNLPKNIQNNTSKDLTVSKLLKLNPPMKLRSS